MVNLSQWRQRVEPLRNSIYLKNLARLTGAAGVAAVLGILTTPVITRFYIPADYGLAAYFTSLVSLFAPVAALRYDIAIVLPDDDAEAASLFWLSAILTCASLIIAFLVTWLAWNAFATQDLILRLGALIFLLPFAICSATFLSILNSWATRKQAFSLLARNQLVAAIVSPVVSIGAYLLSGSTPFGMIFAVFLSSFSCFLILLIELKLPSRQHITWASLRATAYTYRRFPQFNLWMNLLDQFTTSLPILLFTSAFGPSVTAYFALASGTLQLPSGIVGQAVAQVFYERAARQKANPKHLRKLLVANIQGLALVMLIPTALTILAGPQLFALVFGDSWAEAGTYARLLIPAVALMFITSPISTLPTILDQQRTHLILALVSFGLRALGLLLGIPTGSPYVTVALYSIGECIGLLVFLRWLFYYLKRLEKQTAAVELQAEPSD